MASPHQCSLSLCVITLAVCCLSSFQTSNQALAKSVLSESRDPERASHVDSKRDLKDVLAWTGDGRGAAMDGWVPMYDTEDDMDDTLEKRARIRLYKRRQPINKRRLRFHKRKFAFADGFGKHEAPKQHQYQWREFSGDEAGHSRLKRWAGEKAMDANPALKRHRRFSFNANMNVLAQALLAEEAREQLAELENLEAKLRAIG
ncbi:ovulation prohormone-like [Physella acuta]|uniref:ovulation prohormone-like n=1 Tax=Physella acuta TaxID=109671 RepID=UPI0027DCD868|nr:ovulation prohormone-like [Physella acuta]